MKLELEFGEAYCHTTTFVVNGIEADKDDFGEKFDNEPDAAEPYGCGNMQFTKFPPTKGILEKYQINEAEYELIASQLEIGLSFGVCGWCI